MALEIEGNHLFTTAALRYADVLRRRARGQDTELNANAASSLTPSSMSSTELSLVLFRRTDRSQPLVLGELSKIGVFVSWIPMRLPWEPHAETSSSGGKNAREH